MRLAIVLLAAGVGLLGGAASSEIYRWTDAEGRLHFTERLELVPPAHRDAAVASVMRSTQPEPEPEPEAGGQPAAMEALESTEPIGRRLPTRSDSIVIPFVPEGTLMRVDVRINDLVTAPFLVDTGASGISLPSHVAHQLGIRVRHDTPHVRVITANGAVSRAVVRLDSVAVGEARVEGLHATVNPAMDIGLLGGTFFNNFIYRVDHGARVITLTPTDQMRGGMTEEIWRKRFRSLIDPLTTLNDHLAEEVVRRKGEQAHLEQRRRELETALEELENEANRLNVPYAWRQ
ncbi:MAG: TIGR02281 family clan AA aspartic protease [Myxococcota bacterium]